MKFSKAPLASLAVALLMFFDGSPAFAQAKPAGKVLLYTSVPQELATRFADAFMKARPEIKVEIYRAGSTEIGTKLARRARSGRHPGRSSLACRRAGLLRA